MNLSEASRQVLVDALERLDQVELTAAEWEQVSTALDEVLTELVSGRTDRLEPLTTRLANTAFRARVRDRLGPSGQAPAVVPTKPSRVLPVIGLVCAVTLMALGWAIGGLVVLIGTGGFAVFVFVVAMAGTRSRTTRRSQPARVKRRVPVTPAPERVRGTLSRLASMLADDR